MAKARVTPSHPFFVYTSEVLSWRLGRPDASGATPASLASPATTGARTERVLRAAAGRPGVTLLGLGSGALAAALAERLPASQSLSVLSLDPEAARQLLAAGGLPWFGPAGRCQLLADASVQALACLAAATGFSGDTQLLTVNPETVSPGEREGLSRLRRLLAGLGGAPVSAGRPASRTLALMARPDEPDLPAFFAAAVGLADRAVVLWDGLEVPEAARLAGVLGIPVDHLARPLAGDFAAQRNAMLTACPPGWVVCLDPDERPGPGFAAAVDRIVAMPGVGGACFPRLTLYPDADTVKVGHGLWPDLQLRLFNTAPPARPRFVRPIHERLEGLAGEAVLALDAPILHCNRLVADDAAVARKLQAFSRVPGAPGHRLSPEYPTLPRAFFAALAENPPPGRLLRMPPPW